MSKEFENPITARAIIEILGKPKEYVSSTLKLIVNGIENKENIIVVKKEFFEPEENEGMFTAFTELELQFKNLNDVVAFCFENLPTSIEILEPPTLTMEARFLTEFLTGLLAKLHKLNEELQVEKQKNKILTNNLEKSLRNLVILAISRSEKKSMDAETLSRFIGVNKDQLLPLLKKWVEQGFVVEEDGQFKVK